MVVSSASERDPVQVSKQWPGMFIIIIILVLLLFLFKVSLQTYDNIYTSYIYFIYILCKLLNHKETANVFMRVSACGQNFCLLQFGAFDMLFSSPLPAVFLVVFRVQVFAARALVGNCDMLGTCAECCARAYAPRSSLPALRVGFATPVIVPFRSVLLDIQAYWFVFLHSL